MYLRILLACLTLSSLHVADYRVHTAARTKLGMNEAAALGLRENNMSKFLGTWRRISEREGELETCKITLCEQGNVKRLFLKLRSEQQGHFAEPDAHNLTKIHVQHSYGLSTWTIDYSKKYLSEENHSDGNNWVWTWEPL